MIWYIEKPARLCLTGLLLFPAQWQGISPWQSLLWILVLCVAMVSYGDGFTTSLQSPRAGADSFVVCFVFTTCSVCVFGFTVQHIRRVSQDIRCRTWCLQCSTSTLNRIHFRRRKPLFRVHDSLGLDVQYHTQVQVILVHKSELLLMYFCQTELLSV